MTRSLFMRLFLGLVLTVLLASSCGPVNLFNKSAKKEAGKENVLSRAKAYDRLISDEAITENGLFAVHKVGQKFYFEIPDTLLNREILVVTRFIKTPSIVFEKGPNNNLFLRISTLVSAANEEDAISRAVNNSNITPILESFEIKANNEEKESSVIDVTKFVNSENPLLTLSGAQKESYKLSSLESDKSYIKGISTFPMNTEIRSI